MKKSEIQLVKKSLEDLGNIYNLFEKHKDNKDKVLFDMYKILIGKEPRIKSFKNPNMKFLNEVLEIIFTNFNEISKSFYEAENSLYIFLDDNNISHINIFNDSNRMGFYDYHIKYGEVLQEIIKTVNTMINLSTKSDYKEITYAIQIFIMHTIKISEIIDFFLGDVETIFEYLFKNNLLDEFDETHIDEFINISVDNIYLSEFFIINANLLIERTKILLFFDVYKDVHQKFLGNNKEIDKVIDYLLEDEQEEYFLSYKKDLSIFSKMIQDIIKTLEEINKLNRKINKSKNPLLCCEEDKKYWKDIIKKLKEINQSFLFLKKH